MLKQIIKNTAAVLGYEIRKIPNASSMKIVSNVTAHEMDDGFCAVLTGFPIPEQVTSSRLFTTYHAVRYVVENNIVGDFVECGVLQGRHIYVMGKTLDVLSVQDRDIYLYDTFEGMSEPGPFDAKLSRDLDADANLVRWQNAHRDGHVDYCYAPLENVKRNVLSSGYPESRHHFVKGNVLDTLPDNQHEKIAILRLDTDFYDSTMCELEHLYDKIVPGGVLIIDDYGSWGGCRKAVDEYFENSSFHPFLIRTDRSERVVIKQ